MTARITPFSISPNTPNPRVRFASAGMNGVRFGDEKAGQKPADEPVQPEVTTTVTTEPVQAAPVTNTNPKATDTFQAAIAEAKQQEEKAAQTKKAQLTQVAGQIGNTTVTVAPKVALGVFDMFVLPSLLTSLIASAGVPVTVGVGLGIPALVTYLQPELDAAKKSIKNMEHVVSRANKLRDGVLNVALVPLAPLQFIPAVKRLREGLHKGMGEYVSRKGAALFNQSEFIRNFFMKLAGTGFIGKVFHTAKFFIVPLAVTALETLIKKRFRIASGPLAVVFNWMNRIMSSKFLRSQGLDYQKVAGEIATIIRKA